MAMKKEFPHFQKPNSAQNSMARSTFVKSANVSNSNQQLCDAHSKDSTVKLWPILISQIKCTGNQKFIIRLLGFSSWYLYFVVWLQWCWWQCYVGDFLMITRFRWWQNHYVVQFVTNILNRSPTSNNRHQLRLYSIFQQRHPVNITLKIL